MDYILFFNESDGQNSVTAIVSTKISQQLNNKKKYCNVFYEEKTCSLCILDSTSKIIEYEYTLTHYDMIYDNYNCISA
jgi:hypothetical protein